MAKRKKKSETNADCDDVADDDALEAVSESADDDVDDFEDDEQEYEDDEELDDDEDDEEYEAEFSLEDLSQAYAGVVGKKAAADDEGEEATGAPGKGRRGQLIADKVAREQEEAARDDEPIDSKDVDDDSACPISPESIVESILFVGAPRGEKMTSKKIAALLRDVSPAEVTRIAKALNKQYEAENAAFRIATEKGNIKMKIADDLVEFQNEYYGRNGQARLAQSVIDILAVVAYQQPVTRKTIEATRGKSVGSALNQLVRRNLVSVEAVKNAKGSKEKLYSTTGRFLELFQLDTLEDLPQSHDVNAIDEFAD